MEVSDELSSSFGYPIRLICTMDLSRDPPLALNLAVHHVGWDGRWDLDLKEESAVGTHMVSSC